MRLSAFPLLFCSITLSAAAPAHAQSRAVSEFDVAGIRLGASPAAVQASLLKAGYRIERVNHTDSFVQAAAREAARRLDRPTPRCAKPALT